MNDLVSESTREARRISSQCPIAAAFLGGDSGFVCPVASSVCTPGVADGSFAGDFRKILSSDRQVPCRQFCPASLTKIEEKVHLAGTREIADFRE